MNGQAKIMRFVILTEFSLWRALVLGLLGRPALMVAIQPVLPNTGGWLRRAADFMLARGLLEDAAERWPEYWPFRKLPAIANISDLYVRLEKAMDRYFRFAELDAVGNSELAQIYKHACWSHVDKLGIGALFLSFLARDGRLDGAELFGASEQAVVMAETHLGRPLDCKPAGIPLCRGLNLVLGAAIAVATLAWMLRKLGTAPREPRRYFMGSTYVSDPRAHRLLEEGSPSPDQVCVMLHHPAQVEEAGRLIPTFHLGLLDDGVVPPTELPAELKSVFAELAAAFALAGHLPPANFFLVAKQALARVQYRALLRRYRFQWFWGKDDYDTIHIVRNQELRRVGGKGVGNAHGLPTATILESTSKHLDFDLYFVFGRSLYERWYRPHWPEHMQGVIAGAYGMTRDMLARLDEPRPPDIAFYVNPTMDDQTLKQAVVAVAEAFPDRKVYFKVKMGRWRDGFFHDFQSISQRLPNIEFTALDSYDLMLKARYAVGTVSTVVAEAIQYGCVAIALDVQPDYFPFHYRDFPDLTVRDGTALVERIRAIESGRATFDRNAYADLIDLSGRVVYDVVRQHLGLSPADRPCQAAAQ